MWLNFNLVIDADCLENYNNGHHEYKIVDNNQLRCASNDDN